MKKTTFSIIFGLSAFAVLLGALLKIMHFDGAMILLVSGFIVGTIISPIYSFYQAKYIKKLQVHNGSRGEYIGSVTKSLIFTLFTLSTLTVLAGAYMEIMNYSGASIILFTGFIIGSIISSFDNKVKTKHIKELEAQLQAKSE